MRLLSTIIASIALLLMLNTTAVQAQVWENLPGQARSIAAGGDSTDVVWSIGQSRNIFRWNEDSFTWQNMAGNADRIAVADNGVPWAINNLQIYRLRGQVWQSMPGRARDIGAGGGEVFVIGEGGAVYKWNEDSFTWQNTGGNAERITVDDNGIPWVINELQVYRLRGAVWQNMPGKATDIAAGGGEVWSVGESGAVFRWNDAGYVWMNVGGSVRAISVGGTGTPYAIQRDGNLVYRLRGWR